MESGIESIPVRQFYNWATQVCKAMAFMHDRDKPIAHLDLKPHNILLDHVDKERARIKLCDLGAARILGKDRYLKIMEAMGTYGYMPPELVGPGLNATDHVDATKIDVYSRICLNTFFRIPPFEDFFVSRK